MSDLNKDALDRVGKRTALRDNLYQALCKAAGCERDRLGLEFDADLFDAANRLTGVVWEELQKEINNRKLKLGMGGTWAVIK